MCRPALGFGNPLTTMYASPIVSTWRYTQLLEIRTTREPLIQYDNWRFWEHCCRNSKSEKYQRSEKTGRLRFSRQLARQRQLAWMYGKPKAENRRPYPVQTRRLRIHLSGLVHNTVETRTLKTFHAQKIIDTKRKKLYPNTQRHKTL